MARFATVKYISNWVELARVNYQGGEDYDKLVKNELIRLWIYDITREWYKLDHWLCSEWEDEAIVSDTLTLWQIFSGIDEDKCEAIWVKDEKYIYRVKLNWEIYNLQDKNKQDKLTAGENITIENNVISAQSTPGWVGTQAEYDAITTKEEGKLYFIY